MCRIKAVPPSRIPWWDGISRACREDTGSNDPFQKHNELDLLDVCFEWIVLMDQSDFAFSWQLVRPILQFLQACESGCSVGPR